MKTKSNLIALNAASSRQAQGGIGQRALRLGKSWLLLLALIFSFAPAAFASAPAHAWAIIDKLVVEGTDAAPEKVQIWGTFTIRPDMTKNEWSDPESGYLYFVISENDREAAAKLIKDLKARAGADDAVAFGLKPSEKLTVRKGTAAPTAPDTYPIRFTSRWSEPRGWDVTKKLLEAATKNRAARRS